MSNTVLIVSCINGKAAKEFVQWLTDNGNNACSVRSSVVTIPTSDEKYATEALNKAFLSNWVTAGQFAHAMTNFQNALKDEKDKS